MTESLEIKITIRECATPALFQAMVAVSNPRQRAALLKRLAEDALRGSVMPARVPDTLRAISEERDAGSVIAGSHVDSIRAAERPPCESGVAITEMTVTNEDERPFDYAFLADNLGNF